MQKSDYNLRNIKYAFRASKSIITVLYIKKGCCEQLLTKLENNPVINIVFKNSLLG